MAWAMWHKAPAPFIDEGLPGLTNRPRSGRPRTIDEATAEPQAGTVSPRRS